MDSFHEILLSKSVLIAEDDPSTLKWLSKVLKLYFKDVYSADNAMDALDIFNENKIDIVISDIQMPSIDGLVFLQKIATLSPKTLKVVITAFNNENYLNRAVKSGVDFYFKKPVDIDELLFSLSSNLSKNIVIEESIDLKKGYSYDQKQKTAKKDEKIIKLTKKEILLLELLIKNKHGVVSLEYIENHLYDEPTTHDAIRMVIVGLRKKFYSDLIENLKGFGYKINID